MTLLLDTNVMLRLLGAPETLQPQLLEELSDRSNALFFSAISLWEIVIKTAQCRPDFQVDAKVVRRDFLKEGLTELSFTPENAVEVSTLPDIHGDPFDRALIAQARENQLTLLTCDRILGDYPVQVRITKFRPAPIRR
jgi:PIN domain nuclease of toxin-antitoxin system